MSRYGPNNGPPPTAFGGQGGGAAAGGTFVPAGPPPGAMFPPRGPAMHGFPPHPQARPPGMLSVPPMAMLARGFPVARPMVAPSVSYPRPTVQPPAQQLPVALPVGWSEHYTPQNQRYYYNASTGVSTYERPVAAAASAPETTASATPATTVTWIEYTDDASGQKYYYNTVTKATTWDEPEEYRMQQARVEVAKMKSSTEASGIVVAEEQKRKEQKKRQADAEAVKMYDAMAKEDRIAAFKAFLEEKQVSSQFKWQEAQRFLAKEGLDKDPRWRFALSTVGEKKQAFSEYCTQAEKKQNIERKRQAKRVREEYLELLGSIETKFIHKRVTWEDLNDGAEFYGLRKDPRWLAIEGLKDKKDLFEGFVQDALRKRTQLQAMLVEQFKDKFMAKLREKTQDATERAIFAGKRRLDSDLKKKVWQYFDQVEGAEDVRDSIPKHDVYDWTEQYLDVLKSEESQLLKAEREKKKKYEDAFRAKVHEVVDEWLQSDKMGMNISWKEIGEALSKECLSILGDVTIILSERRQRRVFEKKIKKAREQVVPAVPVVQQFLDKAAFVVSPSSTFEDFVAALTQGVQASLDANKPEEGEEECNPTVDANMQTPTSDKQKLLGQLERAVQDAPETATFPITVKHVFQLLQYQAQRAKTSASTRESSRSPSPGSRKRRRSSLDSPRRSRSPSTHRSRSRSRSRSHSPNSRRRHRSRSHTRDPRSTQAVTSYGNLPIMAKRSQTAMLTPATLVRAAPIVVDEAAKAEEIIRQARLKLQAKQHAKQLGATADSEPEEGEEVEDGEVEE